MPSHTHPVYIENEYCAVHTGANNTWRQMLGAPGGNNYVGTLNGRIEASGGGNPHNNISPYIVVYYYKRTS